MSQLSCNPYSYQAPIRDPSAFFGRSAQLGFVREGIARKKKISFVGAPRCGLSSLINRLMAPSFQAECETLAGPLQFIYVDCNLFDDPLPLLRYLLSHVAPKSPLPGTSNWRLLAGPFHSALERMKDKRLVLLFDDFEHIGRNELFVDFVQSLRSWAVRADMSLITATHEPLHKVCHKDIASSPFPNDFEVKKLGPFTSEEFTQFFQATSALSGVDLTPYSEYILELGGRWPYFVQMACSYYYQALTNHEQPDHDAIARHFENEAWPQFEHIWKRLNPDERAVLRDLVDGAYVYMDRHLDLVEKGYILEGKIFSQSFARFIKSSV